MNESRSDDNSERRNTKSQEIVMKGVPDSFFIQQESMTLSCVVAYRSAELLSNIGGSDGHLDSVEYFYAWF